MDEYHQGHILANPEPNAIDFLDTIKLNLFSSEIYVFTPKGDLIILPTGATVLDFAFEIHTQLGRHCIAGKIAHKLVPLAHKLESGDQVGDHHLGDSDTSTGMDGILPYGQGSEPYPNCTAQGPPSAGGPRTEYFQRIPLQKRILKIHRNFSRPSATITE